MDDKFMDRLAIISERYGLSYRRLGEMLGVSTDTAGNYLTGRTKMPLDKVAALSAALRIDANWLLRGQGESPIGDLTPSTGTNDGKQSAPIPYFDVDVMATPIEVFNDQTTVPTYQIEMPGFAECDFAINVYGHSMYPTIESGMIILCKKLTDKNLIVPGEIYFIVTKDFRMIKRLKKSERRGYVIAASDNHNGHSSPDGQTYGSVEISLDKILYIYLVKGSIKRHLI